MANPNNIIHRRRAARSAVKDAARTVSAPPADTPAAPVQAEKPKKKRRWLRKTKK